MKQTVEEAAREYSSQWAWNSQPDMWQSEKDFKAGVEWQAKQAIESLSSVLENWVHGGDADCIIAEFEEKLNNV